MKRFFPYGSILLFLALLAGPVFSDEIGTISATELIQRGRAELSSNDCNAAENSFRLATEAEPTNATAYAGWGHALAVLNRRQEVSLNPTNDQAYYWFYRSLGRVGRYGEAEKACRQAIAINPTNAVYYVGLGYCLENLGHYREADRILEKALSLDPQDPQAHYWLGISRYHEKAYQEAITSLQKSLSLQPTNSDGDFWLGRSFAALNRYEDAARAFQEVVQIEPDDIQAYEWRGVSLLRMGQFDEAAATFEKASEVGRDDKTIRRSLFCCYLLSSQYEKAYRLYPIIFTLGGSALLLSYLIGLAALLRSSFKISRNPSPRLGFSLGWLVVFFQGQIAMI